MTQDAYPMVLASSTGVLETTPIALPPIYDPIALMLTAAGTEAAPMRVPGEVADT